MADSDTYAEAVDMVASASAVIVCAAVERSPREWRASLPSAVALLFEENAISWDSLRSVIVTESGCTDEEMRRASRIVHWDLAGLPSSDVEMELQLWAGRRGDPSVELLVDATSRAMERLFDALVSAIFLRRPNVLRVRGCIDAVSECVARSVGRAPAVRAAVLATADGWVRDRAAASTDVSGAEMHPPFVAWKRSRQWT